MGPFPHDAPPPAISDQNPMGTDGFIWVNLRVSVAALLFFSTPSATLHEAYPAPPTSAVLVGNRWIQKL